MDIHDYSRIPDHMMKNMNNYVKGEEYLGGFLTALFANDLFRTYSAVDHINMPLIPIYISYVYNKLPYTCHGSYEIIENWYKEKMEKKNV